AVRQVVATMPERSQTLLGMLMADPPVPYDQVAASLGIPIGSIGPTRQRCLRALRAKCISAGIEL
ncbi:MAG: RNA polymerase sigma factor, partial [Acidimicrobiales bacterium]